MSPETDQKLLLIIALQPFGSKTDGETRANKLLKDLSDICQHNGYRIDIDYVYPTRKGGGQTWAKNPKNAPRVRQYRANLRHRLERVKPDLILISGRHTAQELNRILKPISDRSSQLKELYRLKFDDLRSREVKTLLWSAPAIMTPCMGHYGQSKIRQSKLPDLYWETFHHRILTRIQNLPNAPHNLAKRAALRKELSEGLLTHGLEVDVEYDKEGMPIVRLPEDLIDHF